MHYIAVFVQGAPHRSGDATAARYGAAEPVREFCRRILTDIDNRLDEQLAVGDRVATEVGGGLQQHQLGFWIADHELPMLAAQGDGGRREVSLRNP